MRWSVIFILYLIGQLALFINLGLRIRNISISPTETVWQELMLVNSIGHVILLILFVFAFAYAHKLFNEQKPMQNFWFQAVAVYLFISTIAFGAYFVFENDLKFALYYRYVEEHDILIDAISQYTKNHGEAPQEMIDAYNELNDAYREYYDWDNAIDYRDPNNVSINLSQISTVIDAESAQKVVYNFESTFDLWELTIVLDRGIWNPVTITYNSQETYTAEDSTLLGTQYRWAIIGDY